MAHATQSLPVLAALGGALLLAGGTTAAQALNDHDNGPLTGIFGFQNSTEGGRLNRQGEHGWNFSVIASSHSTVKVVEDESLKFDGETTRLGLMYRYGVTDKVELGVELPYLFHESGNLDSFISGWHDAFGLPNGVRDLLPEDQIDFEYADRVSQPVGLSRSTNGVGELRFFGGVRLQSSPGNDTALRFSVKFPTGDSNELRGSGGTDFSIGIAGDHTSLWGLARLNGYYRVSGTYIGEPEILEDRYRKFVPRISGGLGFQWTEGFELLAQTTLRGAIYDSEIHTLGDTAAVLTIGANIGLGDRYQLALGVGEDINVNTAPDVTLIVSLDYQGDGRPRRTNEY